MPVFSIVIVCAQALSCNLPHPVYDRISAESEELCKISVQRQVEAEGIHGVIVTCSERRA